MIKKWLFALALVALLGGMFGVTRPTYAQETSICSGTLSGNPLSGYFAAKDALTLALDGTFTSYTLQVNGVDVGNGYSSDTSFVYTFATSGTYTVQVIIDGSATVSWKCRPDSEVDGEGGKVTICHIPPGNPAAAHTISVGKPALQAHLGHGDIEGECGERESRLDDHGLGIAIFTLKEDGIIELYGSCDDGECNVIGRIEIAITLNLTPSEGAQVVIDEDTTDEWVIILFYLHPDPADLTVRVWQLNLYRSETLVNDNLLLFVNAEGAISGWGTQNIWNERLERASRN